MAIIFPLKPRLTGRIVLTIIVAIWVASFLLALPNLLYATVYEMTKKDGTIRSICYTDWPDGAGTKSIADFA